MMRKWWPLYLAASLPLATAVHAEPLHVYGPGGPAPAMKAVAQAFHEKTGLDVDVVAGPTPAWSDAAQSDADIIYSGSEAMMSDFLVHFASQVDPATAHPVYIRPAGILVRPGNPTHIRGFSDLSKPGTRVMVVAGAGQVGLWEDIAGRDGDLKSLAALRSNIVRFASNSADAVKAWQGDPSIQAWIIFPIWSIAHPGLADVVPLEPKYRIYRDCGIVTTHRGLANPVAQQFVRFLEGKEGQAIFQRLGWTKG